MNVLRIVLEQHTYLHRMWLPDDDFGDECSCGMWRMAFDGETDTHKAWSDHREQAVAAALSVTLYPARLRDPQSAAHYMPDRPWVAVAMAEGVPGTLALGYGATASEAEASRARNLEKKLPGLSTGERSVGLPPARAGIGRQRATLASTRDSSPTDLEWEAALGALA